MLLAPLFWIGASLNRRPGAEDDLPPSAAAAHTVQPEPPAGSASPSPSAGETRIINNTITDKTFAEAWQAAQAAMRTRHAHA